MPDFSYEQQHSGLVAGLDEAGCGPWAGPVVAAAAIFYSRDLPQDVLALLNDSKKLTRKRRETAYQHLVNLPKEIFIFATGLASAEEIDHLNIRKAAMLALQRAYEGLAIEPNVCLVDGTYAPFLPTPQHSIIKGDGLSFSIAAASIIAKVERDRLMDELALTYPGYGFEKHAGYGTQAHQKALLELGPCPAHRKTFAPIKALLTAA